MCRAFSLTLTGHSRTWFNNVPEAFISSFGQLRAKFIKAFVINSQRKKDATYLLSIRQGNKNTLCQYMDRFRNTTLEIHDLPLEMEMSVMLQGTQLTSLQESLCLDPTSPADFFGKANKYILHTKVMRVVGGNEDIEQKRKECDDKEDSSRVKGSDVPRPQFHHYTKLL